MKNVKTIWQEMQPVLEVETNVYSYDIWIKPLVPLSIKADDDIFVLCAPSPSSKTEVIAKFLPLLKRALRDVEGAPSDLMIISTDELEDYMPRQDGTAQPAPSKVEPPSFDDVQPSFEVNTLNPKFNFERFIVGDCNVRAFKAAQAVADNPGNVYNPLFIYGGVGLGKTHLMNAIGNAIKLADPSLKVLYVSTDTFINEFITSIRTANMPNGMSFRDKYRKVDVLMIDDVQFMSKKPATADEIFNTFEALKNAGKQMVFAADRKPEEIPDLDSRVRSRFASSLITDVGLPNLETRIAILEAKATEQKTVISRDLLTYVAERVTSNIREMEGVLTKIVFLAKLYERKVNLDICKEALKDYLAQVSEEVTADEIIECTCKYFDVSKADVMGKKKTKGVVEPRQIAMYLISEIMSMTYTAIGSLFGGKEHTTIMHACSKISSQISSDARIRTAVNDITAMVKHE